MGDGGKGAQEDGGTDKSASSGVQGDSTVDYTVWKQNIIGDECNYDGARGISSQDRQIGYGDDREEGQRRGMVLGLVGRGIGDHRWLIRDYAKRRQAKITECVTGKPIYELCTSAQRMEGYSRFLRWRDQYHVPNRKDLQVQ